MPNDGEASRALVAETHHGSLSEEGLSIFRSSSLALLVVFFQLTISPLFPPFAQDLIRGMLCADCKKRIGAREALAHPWFDDVRGDFDGIQRSFRSKAISRRRERGGEGDDEVIEEEEEEDLREMEEPEDEGEEGRRICVIS